MPPIWTGESGAVGFIQVRGGFLHRAGWSLCAAFTESEEYRGVV